MISKKELKELRRKKHREWFDNWYKNYKTKGLEASILEANNEGYTALRIPPNVDDKSEEAFLLDDLTIELLKECFTDFEIEKKVENYTNILGRDSVKRYILISWR